MKTFAFHIFDLVFKKAEFPSEFADFVVSTGVRFLFVSSNPTLSMMIILFQTWETGKNYETFFWKTWKNCVILCFKVKNGLA